MGEKGKKRNLKSYLQEGDKFVLIALGAPLRTEVRKMFKKAEISNLHSWIKGGNYESDHEF